MTKAHSLLGLLVVALTAACLTFASIESRQPVIHGSGMWLSSHNLRSALGRVAILTGCVNTMIGLINVGSTATQILAGLLGVALLAAGYLFLIDTIGQMKRPNSDEGAVRPDGERAVSQLPW